jgi:hypothetical protein
MDLMFSSFQRPTGAVANTCYLLRQFQIRLAASKHRSGWPELEGNLERNDIRRSTSTIRTVDRDTGAKGNNCEVQVYIVPLYLHSKKFFHMLLRYLAILTLILSIRRTLIRDKNILILFLY